MVKQLAYMFVLGSLLILSSCGKDTAAEDDEAIMQYLSDRNLEAIKDPSGVYIIVENEGNENKPTSLNYITIHYEGSYLDGDIFDTSAGKDPIASYLFNFIEGWQIGIPYFGEGGVGEVYVPSELAYGANPPSGIRKNAVLKFEIDLLKVE